MNSDHQAHDQTTDSMHRLKRFTLMLQSDPSNARLLDDASMLAYSCGEYGAVSELANLYQGELPTHVQNRVGLALMRQERFDEASKTFSSIQTIPAPTEVRYNLAASLMMQSRFEEALEVLSDDVVIASPPAAAAKIRCLHHLGRIEEAMVAGAEIFAREPSDALASTLSLVALDLGQWEKAEEYAKRFPESSDSATSLAFIDLRAGRRNEGRVHAELARAGSPNNGRAWLAIGIADLLDGKYESAGISCERGAQLLKSHVGAWVAASWAFILSDRLEDASRCADAAIALEPRFSEAQGVKAVLALKVGDLEESERLAKRAARLDPANLSGTAARVLFQRMSGNEAAAQAIFEVAASQKLSDEMSILEHVLHNSNRGG